MQSRLSNDVIARQASRDQIATDVDEFLRNGGKIEVLATSTSDGDGPDEAPNLDKETCGLSSRVARDMEGV